MEQKSNNTDKNVTQKPRPRRPRLKLPFDNRKQDFMSWIYDNRIGLCITTIVYLSMAIIFVVSKIGTFTREAPETMYIDLEDVALLEEERDRLLQEIKEKNEKIDWSSIQNLDSNENATNENLKDDKGFDASELNEEAKRIQEAMNQNREAYEEGLLGDATSPNNQQNRNNKSNSSNNNKSVKRKGNVTVSYNFKDPVRHARHLIVPAYRCEGGGEVVISATLDQGGSVIAATVISGGDECMRQTAIGAARGSTFDINRDAPSKQQGTITYIFIPQ